MIARRVRLLVAGLFLGLSTSGTHAENITLSKGYVSSEPPRFGILLHLHGCDGLFNRGRTAVWIAYLEKVGFKVFAPNSFAEKRPDKSCKPPFSNKHEIFSIRIAQAKRVLKQLREQYPGARIFVWGHSEGGGVANLIDEKLAGVITTGYHCGYRNTTATKIRPDVPILAFMDSDDDYIKTDLKFTKFSSVAALCESVLANRKNAAWHDLRGGGHLMSIFDDRVTPKVDKFLGASAR